MKLLGLDIGTTTVSAVVVEKGTVLSSLTLKNGAFLPGDYPWEKIQDPAYIRRTAFQAVEALLAKVKNLRSFRWSPLLSFKFPQQLDLTEEYDLNVKPLTIQTEIDTLKHGLDDLKYEITHKVNQQYFEVYLLQATTAFTHSRLDDAKTQLERNKASLRTGKATQSDVDRAQKSVDTLKKRKTSCNANRSG